MKLSEYSIENRKEKKPGKLDINKLLKKTKKESAYYNLNPVKIKRNKKGQFAKL